MSTAKVEVAKVTVPAELGGKSPSWLTRQWGMIAVLLGAVVLGAIIAQERWLLLGAVGLAPLLLLAPIALTMGAFAFVVPFDVVSVIGGKATGTTLTFVVGALAGLTLLATGVLRRKLQLPLRAGFWWLLFILWGGATSLWAMDANRVFERLPTAAALVLFFVVATSVRITEKELSWIVIATVAGGCVAGAYCIHQFLGGQFYRNAAAASGRASLMMGEGSVDPNIFSASLFLPMALAVAQFLASRSWLRRCLALAAVAVMGSSILLTMSRGAMLGLAAMVFVYVRRIGFNRRVLIAIAAMMLALLSVSDRLLVRIETASSSGGAGRFYIWPVGLAAIKHVGLFGAGLENFRTAYVTYLGEGGTNKIYSFQEADAHNIYLSTWVELGVVGLGFMLMGIGTTIQAARRAQKSLGERLGAQLIPYEAAGWAMLVSSFFVGMLWQKAFWLLWIVCALAVRVAQPESVSRGMAAPRSPASSFR